MADKPEDFTEEEAILRAVLDDEDDMPSDDDLELMENGLGPDGEPMTTADVMYDGSNWDPDRPAKSQIPAREWLDG